MARLVLDVNALAIALVADHPGHEHVADRLRPGLRGEETLLLFDYLPLRAHWVLTSQWDIPESDAGEAVTSFLEQPVEVVGADRETLLDAYELTAVKSRGVYDCFYLALARRHDADALVTTDTDFAALCADEPVAYENPVPADVLSEFGRIEDGQR